MRTIKIIDSIRNFCDLTDGSKECMRERLGGEEDGGASLCRLSPVNHTPGTG